MYTVGDYLLDRLKEIGIDHIFGVPGDYNLQFLDQITARDDLKWVGNANELNASYMSDGYARTKKAAAFVTTFGVGELSAINGLAGSFAENVPVIEIVGSPTTKVQEAGKLVHHTLGDGNFNHFQEMHKSVTVAQVKVSAEHAQTDIDQVLLSLLKERKPVYINLPIDVAQMPAQKPESALLVEKVISEQDKIILQAIEKGLKTAKQPLIMVGHEVASFGLEATINNFIKKKKYPVTSLSLGKGIVNESPETFLGIYSGALSPQALKDYVDQADFILTLGVKLTDSVTGGFSQGFDAKQVLSLAANQASLFGENYQGYHFSDVIREIENLDIPSYSGSYIAKTKVADFEAEKGQVLSQKRFWQAMESFVQAGDTIFAEQGTSYFGASQLNLKENVAYQGQPLWGSIGYTFPAVFGSQLANPDSRHILFVGDGSLQLTVQDIGLALREQLNTIVFVINNDGYTVERKIHGPEEVYNDIPQWQYSQLPASFGGNDSQVLARKVSTEEELVEILEKARADVSRMYWIELMLPKMDAPEYLEKLGKLFAQQNKA
ncbi:alpha-keto acid decarboxylase family protein [Streptococcus didelphis]|uniref:Alpha-keto-acid decarboxylase n=1 Tax=Streptococcus didelphis TaxID=102886 RepID=A0ABY9LEZ7_9STRE|nr:alpha-keto acid decarboxylase family protein [Streptococcus didelphis]WMB27557.1 alpha-keto acid decarboxylase family protein [Streptococcus didelphis]WMB29450.1 alpha-keto acid decarboxylase family protein [Streptococcus didelphis]